MAQYKPRTEFTTALAQIAAERGISIEVILETIKVAILAAYRRDTKERGLTTEDENLQVNLNPDNGEARVFFMKGKKKEDVTPPGFSRIAAQTAKQVILQKIREAEKTAITEEYAKRAGSLVNGMILRFDGPNIVVDIGKAEAVMTPSEQVRSENYHLNQRMIFYLDGVKEGPRGQQIVVSRAAKELIVKLFEREVPEVGSKAVEIMTIAREPGVRTKLAVLSHRSGIDPVGSCVGQKGVRVNEVINELFGEKIDIILHSNDPSQFIASALAPAEGLKVKVDEKKKEAQVIVPDDKLSLAIGREGQNARLAAKLTGYKIDIRGESETMTKASKTTDTNVLEEKTTTPKKKKTAVRKKAKG